jgi:succinate-acetate transporter protein
MRRGGGVSLLLIVYVGVGVAIAASHHYFQHVHGWRGVLSAIFAIFLWPLVLLRINLHIHR